MDPQANLTEQLSIADDVMAIHDECTDDGQFSDRQRTDLAHHAYRLAELIQAMNDWSKSQN